MVGRPSEPKLGNTAATAALLVLAGLLSAPALATPTHGSRCADSHDATLDVPTTELTTTPVSHEFDTNAPTEPESPSADQLLKPRFEATVREIFADEEEDSEPEEVADEDNEEPAVLRIRVPGISDEDLVRFKRQMYRRDI